MCFFFIYYCLLCFCLLWRSRQKRKSVGGIKKRRWYDSHIEPELPDRFCWWPRSRGKPKTWDGLFCTRHSGKDSRKTRTAVMRTERHKWRTNKQDGQTNRTDKQTGWRKDKSTVMTSGSQTRGRKTQEQKTETVYKVIRLRADNGRIFCLPLSDAGHWDKIENRKQIIFSFTANREPADNIRQEHCPNTE